MRATKLMNLPVMGMREGLEHGVVIDIVVNAEKKLVSHYIVRRSSRYDLFLVAASDAQGIGPGYLLVPDADALRRIYGDDGRQQTVTRGFFLIDAKVISDAGAALGGVADYEFEPDDGTIGELMLENGTRFPASQIIGMSGATVFVRGKARQSAPSSGRRERQERPRRLDVPTGTVDAAADSEQGERAAVGNGSRTVSPIPAHARSAYQLETAVAERSQKKEAAPPDNARAVQSPNVLRRLLVGKRLAADVTSDDGTFTLSEGTTITEWHMQLAEQHDAVQQLMKHVEPG